MRTAETVIVGGGPAGAAVACGLASLGREVVLIERSGGPHHKVCGEFLSIETQAELHRLGVEPETLGAVAIDHVAVCSAKRGATAALPFRALSLSRYRLDDALLQSAVKRGAQLKRNITVRTVTPADGMWTVHCNDGETLHCRNLVLATGKWSMRGLPEIRDSSMVGLKMHLWLRPYARCALAGRVELGLLDRGYAGLELVENDIANLCFLLPRTEVVHLGPGWNAMRDYLAAALPSLAERLSGAKPLWDKPVAVVCPIRGHLHKEVGHAVYRVGDRLCHIPPFTGDGLAIALGSAALAVEHIRQDLPATDYLAAARCLTAKAIQLASCISAVAANDKGRAVLIFVARYASGLIRSLVWRTRLPNHLNGHLVAVREPFHFDIV